MQGGFERLEMQSNSCSKSNASWTAGPNCQRKYRWVPSPRRHCRNILDNPAVVQTIAFAFLNEINQTEE